MSRYYQTRGDLDSADVCAVSAVDDLTRKAVDHAIDNSPELGRGYSIDVVMRARRALVSCKREGCADHRVEESARDRLQGLINEAEAEDERFEAEREERLGVAARVKEVA